MGFFSVKFTTMCNAERSEGRFVTINVAIDELHPPAMYALSIKPYPEIVGGHNGTAVTVYPNPYPQMETTWSGRRRTLCVLVPVRP